MHYSSCVSINSLGTCRCLYICLTGLCQSNLSDSLSISKNEPLLRSKCIWSTCTCTAFPTFYSIVSGGQTCMSTSGGKRINAEWWLRPTTTDRCGQNHDVSNLSYFTIWVQHELGYLIPKLSPGPSPLQTQHTSPSSQG